MAFGRWGGRGVASLQQWCAADYSSESAVGTRARNNECSQDLRLQWWNMVLELVVLLAVAATVIHAFALTSSRVALSTLLGVVTVMLMLDTNQYLGQRRGSVGVTRHRETTYFVGALLCSLFNFLLILVLGNHHGTTAVAEGAPLGKGTHTATGPAVADRPATTTGPGIV
ncbi:hypothetical protein WJX81_001832 [Elliptochloris bilobata]|uniref:Uncharacterized protein n=1 Tax=Elliptochloris bilobata TaxID=381761 RepID=A0AAW1RAJ6_9CHLO